ncbi:NAD-dependent epimerase/dehydratase family protein [Streptomyces adustus]|uniref:NAD-dependent epimerase/dehydratase family protein n=1 Tax=Streptomyces adustus TaxID=1609272 RepID=A0A5N8V8V2_9ACTN|nr:NAD(P)H-binding protein [Streptomyces adustus]MPY31653.1 NAD-dependent epimerase/dehydratase family protein [Streptomyces adustus]
MRIAVLGGTGLIGSRVVARLKVQGHEARALSLSTGVNVLTGEGLGAALADAEVVVNLTNSPTFDEASAEFFRTSMAKVLEASRAAGVGHVVVLSIVGADKVPELDYYRAKVLQEDLLKADGLPYSVVRATQFMEFVDAVLSWTTDGDTVRLPSTPLQPVAAADVADAVADVAMGAPLDGTLNVAGPEVFPLDELGSITLAAEGGAGHVVTDDTAGMFAVPKGDVLTAPEGARIAPTHYRDWMAARADRADRADEAPGR